MGYSEKVDALDLVIEVLKEHEQTLDHQISRLESLVKGDSSVFPARVVIHGSSLSVTVPKNVRMSMGLERGDAVEVTIRRRKT